MDCIAKIDWREGEYEILAANNFETLGQMVGQALDRDFAFSPVGVTFSVTFKPKQD